MSINSPQLLCAAPDLPPMFDAGALAKALATTERRLSDMRSNGTGPTFHRIGRSVRYTREAVSAWLSKNQFMKA